jgi:hypothetical protein
MKTLVQDRAVVDLVSDPREIPNGDCVYPSPTPTHEIRRHEVKQVVHLPGFLSIHLAEPPAPARVVHCRRFALDRTFCQYRRIDLMSRPLYIHPHRSVVEHRRDRLGFAQVYRCLAMPLGFLHFDLHHQMGSQPKFRVVGEENVANPPDQNITTTDLQENRHLADPVRSPGPQAQRKPVTVMFLMYYFV